jgi:hypothetical protein
MPECDVAHHPGYSGEDMPNRKKKISKAEFVRKFTGEAMKYLESLPPGERDARIEAFGKSVLSSCAPETEARCSTASETRAIPLAARVRESR